MRIFLLVADDERTIFYSEDDESPPATSGGWFARKGELVRAKLLRYEKKLSPRMRRIWTWLQRQTFPDEPMIRQLRNARFLEIHYPTTLGSEQAADLWADYLRSRKGRHVHWMAFNLVLGILSTALAPLPGPNFVQYWLLYRFVCHMHAIRGLRKAARAAESTTYLPSSILDVSPESTRTFEDVAGRLGFTELDSFLQRINHVTEPTADSCESSAITSTKGSVAEIDAIASNESST